MFITLSVYIAAAFLMVAAGLSYYFKKLTSGAALTGFNCALLIFIGTGYTGLILLASFFIAGTVATSWGRGAKKQFERDGDNSRRDAWQVIANGGAATLMAIMSIFFPEHFPLSWEWYMVKNFIIALPGKKISAGLTGLSASRVP
jgi:uncharacterized membrane protein